MGIVKGQYFGVNVRKGSCDSLIVVIWGRSLGVWCKEESSYFLLCVLLFLLTKDDHVSQDLQ